MLDDRVRELLGEPRNGGGEEGHDGFTPDDGNMRREGGGGGGCESAELQKAWRNQKLNA